MILTVDLFLTPIFDIVFVDFLGKKINLLFPIMDDSNSIAQIMTDVNIIKLFLYSSQYILILLT